MATKAARLAGVSLVLAFQSIILLIEIAISLCRHAQQSTERETNRENGEAGQDSQQEGPGLHARLSRLFKIPSSLSNLKYFSASLRLFRQIGASMMIFIFGISFATASFADKYGEELSIVPSSSAASTTCPDPPVFTVDADIGGEGIRIVVLGQIAALVAITLLGTFHCQTLGVKEIGAGLAITHVSLIIALLVQVGRGTLTSADAIVGAMLLDAQGSALGISLVAKEVLAARWQVWIIIGCQMFGLCCIPFLVGSIHAGHFAGRAGNSCLCITAFWWGWIGECPGTTGPGEATIFWLYYACRLIGFVQNAFPAVTSTRKFHEAEKSGRSLKGISFPELATAPASAAGSSQSASPADNDFLYVNYPATVALTFFINGVFSLTSMVAADKIMHAGLVPSSGVVSVGQMIAIVVAAATILRALWLLWRMLSPESGKYVWPFELDVAFRTWGVSWPEWEPSIQWVGDREYWLAAGPRQGYRFPQYTEDADPGPYRLGAIFSEPNILGAMAFVPDAIPEETTIAPSGQRRITEPQQQNFLMKYFFGPPAVRVFRYQEMVHHWVNPRQANMRRMITHPNVQEILNRRRGRIYIITGFKIINGLEVSDGNLHRTFDGPVVFGYRMHEVRLARRELKITVVRPH
ncbi:unnamed protein product [Clonostachys rosea]|uniref:Uncharacterized protein n=1 Tax=Bionectria ochroleuca TaxID=29856 RepID=A0ABY6U3V4_BIOOC|nr:unnamed protein product [Clonostachys rosea]